MDFLTGIAKTFVSGFIEPHADYNTLFPNAARIVGTGGTGGAGFFSETFAYPGTDNMTLTFSNGTTASGAWMTRSLKDLTELRTGQDFYDFIVSPPLEFEPSSSDAPEIKGM